MCRELLMETLPCLCYGFCLSIFKRSDQDSVGVIVIHDHDIFIAAGRAMQDSKWHCSGKLGKTVGIGPYSPTFQIKMKKIWTKSLRLLSIKSPSPRRKTRLKKKPKERNGIGKYPTRFTKKSSRRDRPRSGNRCKRFAKTYRREKLDRKLFQP